MESTYSLEGNTFYAVAYGVLLPPQVYIGIKYRTWGVLFAMFCGLVLEVLGYAARIRLSQGENRFVMYIVCITIGPAFFSAAIYLCLARIITVYGQHLWRVRSRTITITFILADVCALLLQTAGGGSASHADPGVRSASLRVLQAGLAVHLVGICLFAVLSAVFAYTVSSNRSHWDPKFEHLQMSIKFKTFLAALTVATVTIMIRTAFRVAELSNGYDSNISQQETLFFILEGAMVLTATICLTAWHPGVAFQNSWQEADFQLKASHPAAENP